MAEFEKGLDHKVTIDQIEDFAFIFEIKIFVFSHLIIFFVLFEFSKKKKEKKELFLHYPLC